MKQTKIFIGFIILVSLLWFSCKGKNNNETTAKDIPDINTATPTASSSGNASFSCKIDRKDFSVKGSSSYANTVIVTSPGVINFVLVSMEKQQGVPPQFNFFVADHGTTTMNNSNSPDNGQYSAKYSSGGVDNTFGFKEVTVVTTSFRCIRSKRNILRNLV